MKKLLVVLLAAAMCVSMLAGCSSGSKESSSSTSSAESSATEESSKAEETSTSAEESSTAEESSQPETNVELRDFTMLGDDAFTSYYSATDSMEEFYAWQKFREIEEAKGVNMKVEYVVDDQYLTTIQTRFSAMHDIPMFAYNNETDAEVLALAQNGVVLDILPMLDQGDGTAKKFFTEDDFGVTAANKVITPEGQMYWLPNIYISDYDGTFGVGTNCPVSIREDWLNQYGLKVPTTLDEFTTALKTFNENDPSGSGANTPGLNVYSYNPCDFSDSIGQWFGLVRGPVVNVNWDTQKATSVWKQDTAKDYFSYINDLYNQGLYDSEMIGSTDTLRTKVANNQVGALTMYALSTTWEPLIEAAFKADGGGACYEGIYPIQAVEGVTPLLGLEDPVYVWDHFVFTNQLTDPTLGAAFMDAYYSDEHIDVLNYGVEGKNYEIVNGEKQWIQYDAKQEGEGVKYNADALNKYLQEKADARISYGKILYSRYVTPDMTYYQLGEATRAPKEQIWAASKTAYQESTIDYGHWTSLDVNGTLATASNEETEKVNSIYNDLHSASQQDVSALVLGQSSVDDLDTMVSQLDDLGLQDMIDIYQARYNRFKGIE
jgi:putative aldouronate transport system substrate-binding protein